ncbi:MAG: helix-turn-helix transcriptional regulator [bacterium]|nr:helix-turn-helix transcriptional regulator [bacterium]
MSNNGDFFVLKTPWEMMQIIAGRVKTLRLEQNMPQSVLAQRAGISIGTLKRFEKTGEIQFKHLLQIAWVLNRLEDIEALFAKSEIPVSLFTSPPPTRQRARQPKGE